MKMVGHPGYVPGVCLVRFRRTRPPGWPSARLSRAAFGARFAVPSGADFYLPRARTQRCLSENGGRDGCCPRWLPRDGRASLLFLFTAVVRRPGNAPGQPIGSGFTGRLASLAIYRRSYLWVNGTAGGYRAHISRFWRPVHCLSATAVHVGYSDMLCVFIKLVRSAGIAPASPDWHSGILLLNDDRIRSGAGAFFPHAAHDNKERTPLPPVECYTQGVAPAGFTLADVSVFNRHTSHEASKAGKACGVDGAALNKGSLK